MSSDTNRFWELKKDHYGVIVYINGLRASHKPGSGKKGYFSSVVDAQVGQKAGTVKAASETLKIPLRAQPTVRWLCRSKYGNAAKAIASIPSAANKLASTVGLKISKESRYFCQTSKYRGKSTFNNVKDAYNDLNNKCPLLCEMLKAVIGKDRGKGYQRIIAAAYILLNARSTRINTWQKVVGILLWKGQLQTSMFKRMKFFGVTTSRGNILNVIDNICKGYDNKIKKWKATIEIQENMQDESFRQVPKTAAVTVRWLCSRRYPQAVKSLTKIPSAANELSKATSIKIKQEARYYCKTSQMRGKTHCTVTDAYKDLKTRCSTICKLLESIAGGKNAARVVAAASILLNVRNSKINAFQRLIGLLMWKGQLRAQMFRRLRFFGLCCTRGTTLRVLDGMTKKYDHQIQSWKAAVEQQENMKSTLALGSTLTIGDQDEDDEWMDIEVIEDMDCDQTSADETSHDEEHMDCCTTQVTEHSYATTGPDKEHIDHSYGCTFHNNVPVDKGRTTDAPSLDTSITFDSVPNTMIPQIDEPSTSDEQVIDVNLQAAHPSYQLIFDNVNILKKARHKSTLSKNKQYNLIQAYSVLDRVLCDDLSDEHPILPDITQLPTETWWLPEGEQASLKSEIMVLVTRIAVAYVPCLKPFKEYVVQHIQHEHSSEASSKSELNKLGLYDIDEMYTAQMIEFMEDIQKYCPRTVDGKIKQIPLGGDGLSVQKAYTAQRARSDGFRGETRLDGFIPKPEDWHEGVIILQDTFKNFYNARSCREKGTLYHLREVFDRRGVKASAKDAVNDNREFLHFVTHGYVVLAVMHVLGIDKIEGIPSHFPSESDSKEEKHDYLNMIARIVVEGHVFPFGVLPSSNVGDRDPYQDHKRNYVCALLREGLMDIARMDAVKEGDGLRILRHWRYDFVHFDKFNHRNYRVLTLRFIAQVYGLLTPRMAAKVIHNRTVNKFGGAGNNVSLDLFLEFLNKEVKDDLRRSGPNLTTKLLERIGRSKQIMDELISKFDHDVEMYTGIGRHRKPDWSAEVSQLVMELHSQSLFCSQPGREFPTFPKFPVNSIYSVDKQKLGAWVTVQLTYLSIGI